MRIRKLSISSILLFLVTAVLIVAFVMPYLYMVLTSVKPPADAIAAPARLFPRAISFENYANFADSPRVRRAFVNSVIVALASTAIALVFAIPSAYGIAKYSTRLTKVFMMVTLAGRMIPYVAIAIPFFFIINSFRLIDTRFALTLAHSVKSLPLAIWLMASFFEGFPEALEEAARIDGCSRLGALLRIIVPSSTPGIAVTAVFSFLLSWNEFLFALLLTSVEAITIPIAISIFKTGFTIQWGTMTAIATVFSLPVVIFSIVMQKRIVSGMTLGAVKQ